jgi:hypothetical protein
MRKSRFTVGRVSALVEILERRSSGMVVSA